MKSLAKPIAASLIAGLSIFTRQATAAPGPIVTPISKNEKSATEINKAFIVSLFPINEPGKVRLIVYKPEQKRLLIKLLDMKGTTIYSFYAGKKVTSIGKDYDFAGAEDGLYTFQVSDGESVINKQIRLQHVKVKEETKISIE
ncbi:MAG: hypothetical protein JST47_11220 [Bacteroidetes bacterium]|nr:hypothetical protein [Bacteroidota bacterium]MBS1972955.1 hypothetical protein [Bacteroidota bacterium]